MPRSSRSAGVMPLRGLPPVSAKNAMVLILGSFPGPASLRKRQYYAHPQNDFWGIMQKIAHASGEYADRCRALKKARIALWDVLKLCERDGSSDSRIRREVPNDIEGFLARHRGIRAVYLNGRKAESAYRRYFGERIRVRAQYLPSTSPAHAVKSFGKKIRAWRRAMPLF